MGMDMIIESQTGRSGQRESDKSEKQGAGSRSDPSPGSGEGSTTRRRILDIARSLMAQRGVDGTSMRDLAAAAGLNVASLYHYFPSKRDLLEAVLVEQGLLPVQAPRPEGNGAGGATTGNLAELLADILVSIFEVEDFARLVVGESMRDESTARALGRDLLTDFECSITKWVAANQPRLAARSGAEPVARLLSALVVGTFVQYACGVREVDPDPTALALERARETADILAPAAEMLGPADEVLAPTGALLAPAE